MTVQPGDVVYTYGHHDTDNDNYAIWVSYADADEIYASREIPQGKCDEYNGNERATALRSHEREEERRKASVVEFNALVDAGLREGAHKMYAPREFKFKPRYEVEELTIR